ncbi:MAG: proton-conducting transporter membrane subunit [Elusimicrobiota bacterium]|jgi:formate hydrogenlyase subunit 3/multisubunit Na+/H+ antiporter MnhD subunit
MSLLIPYFRSDPLSLFIGGFVLFFFALTVLYSVGFLRGRSGLGRYYAYVILTLVASLGAVFADHLIVFIVCWGFLGFLLYLLIHFGRRERTPATAKKALIIVAGADVLMILGIALLWRLTGFLRMSDIHVALTSRSAIVAYLCLASGALAKAGSMPFHSWVPDTAEDAPIPVTAYLPASLDKLLGIYLLVRLSLGLFQMTPAMNTLLMTAGSLTIVAAVMMALVQHDLKRLLGYHAVSQVGYMVLGIGTGNPVGIAGGLFHMLNNAIYKNCLFLGGGAVEKNAGTTELDKLGGLARAMPVTFGAFLVAALAISGVPPLNGFASKWMIYQGIIESARTGSPLGLVWLVAAMFGSALTLASFMKVVHAVFLGQPSVEQQQRKTPSAEVGLSMQIPMVTLAVLCLLFGVFAASLPLRMWIFPSLGSAVDYPGIWNAGLTTVLLVVGMLVGLLIYWVGTMAKTRETAIFTGGETVEEYPEMRVSGTEFYHTISEWGCLKTIYGLAEKRRFDPYDLGVELTLRVNRLMQYLHNGILPTYLSWGLFGAAILFLFLMG